MRKGINKGKKTIFCEEKMFKKKTAEFSHQHIMTIFSISINKDVDDSDFQKYYRAVVKYEL